MDIKEAVEIKQKYRIGYVNNELKEADKTLMDLAIQYESMERFPKKKDIYELQHGAVVSNTWREEGRNEGIDECENALMKMLDKEKMKKVLWKAIPNVHEEVNEYELRADNGDYSPNEHERMLMEDFAHGLVEEIVDNATQAFIDYMKEGLWEILI